MGIRDCTKVMILDLSMVPSGMRAQLSIMRAAIGASMDFLVELN